MSARRQPDDERAGVREWLVVLAVPVVLLAASGLAEGAAWLVEVLAGP